MEKLVPKLRFPDFKGEWDKSNLQDLSKKNISYGIVQTGNTIENGVPCLRVIDLTKDEIIVDDLITTSEKISNSYKKTILEEDELMIALRGVIGHTRVVTKNLVGFNLTRGIARVSPKRKIISPQFLLKYLNSPKCLKVFDQRKNGSALKEIPIGELRKILVEFPSLDEQQKIASFLTSVDERLTLLAQQKEKLEQYKKGVMQQIFSQKLRFKPDLSGVEGDENGNSYPDCEEKKLGEVCKLQGGFAFKSNEFKETGIPIIRISNISNKDNFIDSDSIVYYDKIEKDENFTIKKGDLIIAMSGATTGKSSIYNLENIAYLNQRVGLFKSTSKKLEYNYLIQFVFSEFFKKQLDSLLVAGAQPNISSKDIESLLLPFPCLEEQQKIASFLSAIDVKIEGVSNKIAQTKTFKKGLLQQMFV